MPTQNNPNNQQKTSVLSQQAATQPLQWIHNNGKKQQLTLQQLEKWFATLEKNDPNRPLSQNKPNTLENNTLIAADFLARFGLQANNIMLFLQSPAATPLLSLYTEALHELAEQEEAIEQIAIQEALHQRHRRHALLLLGLLFEEDLEAYEQELTHNTEAQLQKLHATEKAQKAAAEATSTNSAHAALQRQINEHLEALDALSEKISHKLHESNQIHSLLSELEIEKNSLEIVFSEYDKQLDHLDHMLQHVEKQKAPQTTLTTYIQELENTIRQATPTEQQSETTVSLTNHKAHQLRLMGLQDMLAVYRGEKYLADVNGNSAKTMKNAHFVLPQDKKIVQDNQGRSYLIPKHEKLESLQTTADGKLQLALAHQAYQKACQNHLSVHQQFAAHKQKKIEAFDENHGQKYQQALAQSKVLQREILFLSQQANKIKIAHDKLTQKLTASIDQTLQKAPTPTPKPGLPLQKGAETKHLQSPFNFAQPAPNHHLGKTLQLALKLMLHHPTPQHIEDFKRRLTIYRNPQDPLMQAVEKQLGILQSSLAKKSASQQIIQDTLKMLDKFACFDEKKPETTTAPTPFSTRIRFPT